MTKKEIAEGAGFCVIMAGFIALFAIATVAIQPEAQPEYQEKLEREAMGWIQ